MKYLLGVLLAPVAWALGAVAQSRNEVFDVITADGGRIDDLREQLAEISDKVQAIIDEADEDDRDLEDSELTAIEKLKAKADRITKQIEARSALAPAASRTRGRRSAPSIDADDIDLDDGDEPVTASARGRRSRRRETGSVPATAKPDRSTMGFQSFGEFAGLVHGAAIDDRVALERFENVASTYGNESVGSEGGYLVPPEFRQAIWEKVNSEDSLMSRTTEFVTGGNSVTMPKDETTPWEQSSGVQAYWDGEGDQLTQSKPKFELDTQRLNRLTGLVVVSEEQLEDTIGLESYLNVKMPQKMDAKINTAIYRGNGVGQPLGVMNAASLITISKESGQAADTIVAENISNMWSRMWAPSRRNAVWLINQDIEPQLDALGFGDGNTTPLFMPAGGLSGSPLSTLKGRPVLPIEPCSTLGDVGDICLVDLEQYAMLKKAGEIRQDTSMHLYFDQVLMAFRFVFRLTGKPLWNSTITPENGNATRSWAVTLEART